MDLDLEKYKKIPNEIFCSFKTNLPEEFKIPENPINIQTNLNENTLSELLNQILKQENEEPKNQKFEFLIENEFLRGNLKSHIMKHELISEKTIIINYCLALNQPNFSASLPEEDWISSISMLNLKEIGKTPFVVSLFNSSLAFYNKKSKLIGRKKISGKSLKTIKIIENEFDEKEDFSHVIYCGFGDENIRINYLTINESDNKKKDKNLINISEKFVGKGHEGSIETIDINPIDNSYFCSGGWDHNLLIWHLSEKYITSNAEKSIEPTKKKIKLSTKEISSLSQNKYHHDGITKAIWLNPETIITSSLDHTIKYFDTNKLTEFDTINCKDSAVTSLSLINKDYIISGHEDGYIKMWDRKAKNNISNNKIVKAHSSFISDIKNLINSETIFATASYDNNVKIFDIRSTFPLFTLKSHSDKIFCLEWNGENQILSGGADSKVDIHTF